jgi:hypothetical protein
MPLPEFSLISQYWIGPSQPDIPPARFSRITQFSMIANDELPLMAAPPGPLLYLITHLLMVGFEKYK